MFITSKLFSFATQPLAWAVLLLLCGLICLPLRRKWGMGLSWGALLMMLLLGWQPLPDLLLRHLEGQYAEMPPHADLSGYAGVVVLGGAMEAGHVQEAHTQPLLNNAAERMTAPVALLRRYPKLRLVFTGGEGTLLGTGPSEAERARIFFESLGLTGKTVAYEAASRNTFENARFAAKLPGVDVKQRWLLVSSAWHMPRAMASFTRAGWNVTAYPVDFRTGRFTPWSQYSLLSSSEHWQLVLHELLGLLAYRLAGQL